MTPWSIGTTVFMAVAIAHNDANVTKTTIKNFLTGCLDTEQHRKFC